MIYLDYHATTPVDPRVADIVLQGMTDTFGNASSLDHAIGDRAEAAVKQATRHVADLVGATPRDIIFTSGATESLNLAIQGTINTLPPSPNLGEGLGVRAYPKLGKGMGARANPASPFQPLNTKPFSIPVKLSTTRGALI